MSHERREPEQRPAPPPEVEQRPAAPEVAERSLSAALASAGEHALDAGAATLAVLGAKDLYAKGKDMIRPNDNEPPSSPIILPPGVGDDE